MALQKKVCMLGSFGVGKTSLVSQFVYSIFSEEYLTTIGVKIDKRDLEINGETLRLILWDLAGDDRFDTLQHTYLKGSAGNILVVDGSRRDTYAVALDIMETYHESVGSLPMVCAINKSDLKADWEVTEEDIENLRKRNWEVMLTSATDKQSVEELFHRLGNLILDDAKMKA